MRKEHFIFLILIVAAAVTTGSTIGLASNFDILVSNSNPSPVQIAATDNVLETSNEEKSPYLENDLMISQQEQEQIIEMLKALGMVSTNDYDTFIKDFQAKHSLDPTGNLDSQTLSLIIEEVKYEKASRSLKDNSN